MSTRTRTIARNGSHEIVIKKSRFITTLRRITSDSEARQFIDRLKKENWDASHNCSAWVIGERAESQRSNDDGEPSGTAGMPMLNVLNQRDLTDVVAVVTRYFGGTKLGASGLIRAYGQAVSDAIDRVGIVERRPLLVMEVSVGHDLAGRLDNALRTSTFELAGADYGEKARFVLHIEPDEEESFQSWISAATNGTCQAHVIGQKIIEAPISQ